MRRLASLFLQVLGVNAVPVGGLFFAGWSPATALVLYWGENAVGGALVALRIARHRALTGKRGHYRAQLGGRIESRFQLAGRPVETSSGPSTLLGEFVTLGTVFTLGHGLLLLVAFSSLGLRPEWESVARGAAAMAAFQVAGTAVDLFGLGERPFAWIKGLAERAFGRVVLLQLALLVGVWMTAGEPHPERFFAAFGFLKTISDLTSLAGLRFTPDPERPPGWVGWLGRVAPRRETSAEEQWRETFARERRLAEEDEQVSDRWRRARRRSG